MAGHELKRVLGKGFSIAASLGLIIGLGILRTPGEIAVTVQDPVLYLGGERYITASECTIRMLERKIYGKSA